MRPRKKQRIMIKTPVFLCMVCTILFVSACSSYEEEGPQARKLEQPPAERIDITVADPEGPGAADAGTPWVDRSASSRTEALEVDVVSMAQATADPAVQIFPLDGDAGPETVVGRQTIGETTSQQGGVKALRGIYGLDPSVEVFPLDDTMKAEMPRHLMPSGMQPLMQENELTPLPAGATDTEPAMAGLAVDEDVVTNQFIDVNVPGEAPKRIYFAHGTTGLDEQALERVAAIISAYQAQNKAISVEGHASTRSTIEDPQRRKIVNLKVSMNRAYAVAKRLIEKGVPAEMIRLVAWGEGRPLPPSLSGMDNEAASRRVDIVPAE